MTADELTQGDGKYKFTLSVYREELLFDEYGCNDIEEVQGMVDKAFETAVEIHGDVKSDNEYILNEHGTRGILKLDL